MSSNLSIIKRAAREDGCYFFTPDTMRFFNSRIHDVKRVKGTDDYRMITSEQFEDEPRKFSVRHVHMPTRTKTMSVDVVGVLGQHATIDEARAHIWDAPNDEQEN